MTIPDKKPRRARKRSAANGRKNRSVNGKGDAFTLGLADFEKIIAVEGLHLSSDMREMFREFVRKNLSVEARRKRIITKYGKQPA